VAANIKADPGNAALWRFRLQRLEAEPVLDSIMSAAESLDLTVGGPSFDTAAGGPRRGPMRSAAANRRAVYMVRGFATNRDVSPNFLQVFDVEDGRAPCPLRTQTVTAPQGLFMMNSEEIDKASTRFAERLRKEAGADLASAVDLGFRIALARTPSASEKDSALSYIQNDPERLKGFA